MRSYSVTPRPDPTTPTILELANIPSHRQTEKSVPRPNKKKLASSSVRCHVRYQRVTYRKDCQVYGIQTCLRA